MSALDDAEALYYPEIGAALLTGNPAEAGSLAALDTLADDTIESIEPEYFVFSQEADLPEIADPPLLGQPAPSGELGAYLRGFARAADTLARDLGQFSFEPQPDPDVDAMVQGSTWGIQAVRAHRSVRSGRGIRVAVLDTGMDLGHPDFAGRTFASQSFVGQPVADLHGHGTHCIGTACGPKAPAVSTPRYGIAYDAAIFVGKVLGNSGGSVGGSVLAGMNWAIANRCTVISLSLGGRGGVQASYTAAGRAALRNGLLMIAAAGNDYGQPTGFPANSPTIMSVAALDARLRPAPYSNRGKIDIAGPGSDVFSSVPRPTRHGTKSGTSMATPHVAGCAALWAQVSPSLRGERLWKQLQASARRLPYPSSMVGAGLVQAP